MQRQDRHFRGGGLGFRRRHLWLPKAQACQSFLHLGQRMFSLALAAVTMHGDL